MPSTISDRIRGVSTSTAVKAPVDAIATEHITLSGAQTINGVSVTDGDRVLVINQNDKRYNGIYDVSSSGAWRRSADFDGSRDIRPGTLIIGPPGPGTGEWLNDATAETVGEALWPATDAELTAGLTDDDLVNAYPPGDVRRYGADGSGDDTAAFASAILCNDTITVPAGYTFTVNALDVDGWAGDIIGYGATLTGTSASGIIAKTDHGYRLGVFGLRFEGTAKGIKYNATPSGSQHDDFRISDCTFAGTDYGIHLVGAREGRIINCSFIGTNGIYRQATVNTDVIGCYWKNCTYAINDDGDGTAYSAGLKVIGGTMIGCEYGIQTGRNDYTLVSGCMIDYCDNPVRVIGTDIAQFSDNYITTRTTNPAVYVDRYDVSTPPREIRFVGNTISSNTNDVTSDCMVMKYVSTGYVAANSITFYWRYGLDFSNCTNMSILNNKFSADPSSTAPTKYSVYESAGGSNSNYVRGNELNSDPSLLSAQLESNRGYYTQHAGEVVASGGVTSVVVAHGLSYTPQKYDVLLTPTNSAAATAQPFISAVDATNLTVGFVSATGGSAGVAWTIRKRVT